MKVTIRGENPVTSEQFKGVIDKLNDYFDGLKVKNMTCYVRFTDEIGDTIEPIDEYGNEKEINVSFKETTKGTLRTFETVDVLLTPYRKRKYR